MNTAKNRRENIDTLNNIPKKPLSPLAAIVLAIVLAILTGAVFTFFPPEIGTMVAKDLLYPAFKTVIGLFSMIASFVVFFSVLFGICNMGDIDKFNKHGAGIIYRFLGMTLIDSLIATIVCLLMVSIMDREVAFNAKVLVGLYKGLLTVIPTNAVTPFVKGNILHILIMALLIGIVILMNKTKLKQLLNWLDSVYLVVMGFANLIGRLTPLVVYLSISLAMLGSSGSSMLGAGKIIAVVLMISLSQCLLYLVYHSIVLKKPLLTIIKNNRALGLIGQTAASPAIVMMSATKECQEHYGVPPETTAFCYPIYQIFNKLGMSATFVVFTYFMCAENGIKLSPSAIAVNVVAFALLALAKPPVANGDIPIILLVVKYLGLPNEAVAIYASFALLLSSTNEGIKAFMSAGEVAVFDKKLRKL